MTCRRRTVADTVRWQGKGLHSGNPVRLSVHPGEAGIWFRCGASRFQATPEEVTDTRFATRLGTISTVEHLMSAFAGLEITDAEVEVDAPEMPAMDGSAAVYVESLNAAGFTELGDVELRSPFSRLFLHEGEAKLALSAGTGHWRYVFHSKSRYPFDQTFETQDILADFPAKVAPARTFGWDEDLVELSRQGLARGLDYESAILISDDQYLTPLRFEDEPARHKLLDAIGDLYLSGVPIRTLNFHGEQTGHRLNVEMARRLRLATNGA